MSMPMGCPFNGTMLHRLSEMFPRFVFTAGIHGRDNRYGVYVYDKVENDPYIHVDGELCFIEFAGSSEKDLEVLYTKIAMIHG